MAVVMSLVTPADSILLRVLTINDFHGSLEPRTYPWSRARRVGGLAALKGTMDSLAADCHCPTLRLDAGDQLQGSLASNLVYGRSTVEAMNLLGLDAAAIGNHEFDWGVDTLVARLGEAAYPWLLANVFDSATGRRPGWAKPFAMVNAGPFRVAVVGYATPMTKIFVQERFVRGLTFKEGRAALDDVLTAVRAERPDLTVLVAHEGARCDSLACVGEILRLARQFDSTAFDLIVAGHTHTEIATFERGVPIVSARSNGTTIGVVDLVRSLDGMRRWRIRLETVYVDAVRSDSAAVELVARYRPLIERLANQVIVRLRDSLVTRRGEFPLGNLIADAHRGVLPADVGLMNNGGIRRSLLPGPITYADLFEVQPFGNNVVRVNLTGADLKRVLEHALEPRHPNAHVSGITVRYDSTRAEGDRIIEIRKRDGTRIEPRQFYVLAVNDFVAGGGDGFEMLRALPQRRTGKVDLEALIDWVRNQPRPLRAPRAARWIPVNP
jgi:2',3'-cyclic-nucleotide 2'-phosphodiesterase (5'-nucleotidase family)